ncbi:spore coat protein GerQ [Jeotgalibacillus proteolyticus]|uniref:Spore coat protein GerQ n=1 Tax=Jeotgalibacillus proteolyticus TaxID=2082395 RepID=A0A2S5G9M0_9BACL|nr:spore coat protein GerQ [Jeotgalibacillus proteolyticus]PPA69700.1 spore coat protein GerQ [Jeotgalibacillus proteolyticus]
MNNPSGNQKPQQPAQGGQGGQQGQAGHTYSQPYYQPQTYPSYTYPTQNYQTPTIPQSTGGQSMLPNEESYIENILRLNRGKVATVYMTFENNREWNAKIFKGIVEAAGRDHIILSDPKSGLRYILPMIYLDYITFDEEIQYSYPYSMTHYSPR